MIDTHCHIDAYAKPLEIAQESESLGISTIAMTNLPSEFERRYKIYGSYKKVRVALGLHPMHFLNHNVELPLFMKLLNETSYIGEIGLDFSDKGRIGKETQIETFNAILGSLKGKKKILSVHSLMAEKEVYTRLLLNNIPAVIFHWYSGSLDLIEKISDAGYFFSINTEMISYSFGQEIIKRIPMTNVLTESDGPYIEHEGRPARPKDILKVIQYLSFCWQMSEERVDKVINSNFRKLIDAIK